ncbi:hypothetical protein [Metamycoplasma buccale]|uniref:hypothetical protein n=1 Tax=Metamycoplasma buccale TaxID=55602 RepID=UPI00398E634B
MTNVSENKNKILKDFSLLCEESKLWYSLDNESLLLAITSKNPENLIDHYDVMMTYDSYEILKSKYPDNIIDNTKHSEYGSLQCKFVYNSTNIFEESPFININFILPTKIKKVKNFISLKNKAKSFAWHYSTYNSTNVRKIKNKINIAKLLKLSCNKLIYKDLINSLYDEEFEGYIVTDTFVNKHMIHKWIPNITYKRKTIMFQDMEIKILNEYDIYLNNLFGPNYNQIDLKRPILEHKNMIELWNTNLLEKVFEEPSEIKIEE